MPTVRPSRGHAQGPGPNCPIQYTVSPSEEERDKCIRALELLDLLPPEERAKARRSLLEWLDRWYDENNRLPWRYYTLRYGLHSPRYAAKFQAFHADGAQLRFIRAPNQVGKSWAAAAEIWFWATAKHPWQEIPEKWANPRQEKTILIVTGSDKNREGVYKALWALCPINELDWELTHYDSRNLWGVRNPVIIVPRTNVKVIFRSSNQDTDSLNSLTADFIWIDEPPERGTIDEIRRAGLAKRAPIVMTFTPVGEEGEDFTWLRHYVEGDKDAGIAPVGNWSQHQVAIPDCPWFDPEEQNERIGAIRPEQVPQRIYGEWEGIAIDRAFSHFDDRCTYGGSPIIGLPRADWRFVVSMDHGEKAETEVGVLLAYASEQPVYVLGEYISKTKTSAADDAHGLLELFAHVGIQPAEIALFVGDINSAGKEGRGASINRLIALALQEQAGLTYQPVFRIPKKYPGSVETEEKRINMAFQQKLLVVHRSAQRLIRSLRHYQGKGTKQDRNHKHAIDALRYGTQEIFNRLGYAKLYSSEYSGRVRHMRVL